MKKIVFIAMFCAPTMLFTAYPNGQLQAPTGAGAESPSTAEYQTVYNLLIHNGFQPDHIKRSMVIPQYMHGQLQSPTFNGKGRDGKLSLNLPPAYCIERIWTPFFTEQVMLKYWVACGPSTTMCVYAPLATLACRSAVNRLQCEIFIPEQDIQSVLNERAQSNKEHVLEKIFGTLLVSVIAASIKNQSEKKPGLNLPEYLSLAVQEVNGKIVRCMNAPGSLQPGAEPWLQFTAY